MQIPRFNIYALGILLCSLCFTSCGDSDDGTINSAQGNFDALWSIIDEHYTFFEYKDVDWEEVGNRYRAQLKSKMTYGEFFDICGEMLKELKDGHTNLTSGFDVSRYWIWEQYPENYNERIVDENYLHFNFRRTSGIKYEYLPETDSIGYLRYGSFSSVIGEGNLDAVLSHFSRSRALIIDVRSNGGGLLTNVETLIARFINQPIHAGSISHKRGPAHDDFSKPFDYYFNPANGRVHYDKPIVVLSNRGSYSATNNFVSIMKTLPNVTIVGDSTGGGCGMPFTNEIPCGWTIRFSGAVIRDPNGEITEFGVAPNIKVDITESDSQRGRDTILDTAIALLSEGQ